MTPAFELDPGEMSVASRDQEIASLLATGYTRLRSEHRGRAPHLAPDADDAASREYERELDLSAEQSVDVDHEPELAN